MKSLLITLQVLYLNRILIARRVDYRSDGRKKADLEQIPERPSHPDGFFFRGTMFDLIVRNRMSFGFITVGYIIKAPFLDRATAGTIFQNLEVPFGEENADEGS